MKVPTEGRRWGGAGWREYKGTFDRMEEVVREIREEGTLENTWVRDGEEMATGRRQGKERRGE